MKIVHYGNACFSLFHNNLHILCDPWIEGPAVAGGWAKFPPSPIRMSDLPIINYIYISHIHSDHCEEKTLEKLPRDIPIIVMNLKPNFLYKKLLKSGFNNIIKIDEGNLHVIDDELEVEVFPESYGHICANIIDSSILFKFKDYTILNCNDNKPSSELCTYIKSKYNNIDVAFLPSGGGSGYPAMYANLTDAEKFSHVNSINLLYLEAFRKSVDLLKPKIAIPVAGGFIIRGDHPMKVNWQQTRRFNLLEVADDYYQNGISKDTKILPLQPGLEIDVKSKQYIKNHYRPWTNEEISSYIKEACSEPIIKKINTNEQIEGIIELMRLSRLKLWSRQALNNMKPEYNIYITIKENNRSCYFNLAYEDFEEVKFSGQRIEPYLELFLDQDTSLEWILGLIDFNMLDSGHRIEFCRSPNKYVVEAYYLMSMYRLC